MKELAKMLVVQEHQGAYGAGAVFEVSRHEERIVDSRGLATMEVVEEKAWDCGTRRIA
jgi:hypothetical protein